MLKPILLLLSVFLLSSCKPEAAKDADTAPEQQTETQAAEEQTPLAAAVTPVPLPAEMMFHGQPIDPMCFALPLSDDPALLTGTIALDRCRADDIAVPAAIDWRPDAQGWIGYEYGYRNEGEAGAVTGRGAFSKYRYIGQVDGYHVVLTAQSGGGSGIFTALSGFRRVGDTVVRVKDYAAGDRCNGGIPDAVIKDGALSYQIYLTPPDMLGLAGLEEKMVPYKDLESSAASCFATAHYKNGQFTGMELLPKSFEDRLGWTGKYKYQACFNEIGRGLAKAGLVFLNQRLSLRLAQTFRSTCLRN